MAIFIKNGNGLILYLHSTSMPSPVPTPNLNHIPTSIPLANQDTEIYPSNNNYANDDPLFHYFNDKNELNNDQAYIISTSEYHKNDYYVAHDPNPANSSDSMHPISQDEEKIVDNNSAELFNEK